MKKYLLSISLFLVFSATGVLAQPGGGPAKDAYALCPLVVVKDEKATPASVSNDGTASIGIRCTVFSTRPNTRITAVWADFSHTLMGGITTLSPAPRATVSGSAEGSYEAVAAIPLLVDAGTYRIPILARDSAGNLGQGRAVFSVAFRRNPAMPAIGTSAFMKKIGRFANGSFVGGNRVEVLDSGPKALERRLSMVRNARRQINLECYTFDQGLADGKFMDHLLERARAGVEVNVVLNADTQVSTSPLSTLRLSTHELLGNLIRDGKAAATDPLFKGLLSSMRAGEMHVIVPSGRDIAAKKPPSGAERVPDHWLSRTATPVARAKPAASLSEQIRSRYQGPGGLPALPLLDYAVHEKILLADGKSALVGGRNLEDRYFTRWLDSDLYLEGPVVGEIAGGFARTWNYLHPPDAPPHSPARFGAPATEEGGLSVMFVQSAPWNRNYSALKALVFSIAACRKSFLAYSQYLAFSDCLLKDAIIDAARRGVNVEIITNSAETSRETSFATGYFISLNAMGDLIRAGVKIHEMRPNPNPKAPQPYMHQKEFLFDSQMAAMGSFNLSLRSSYIESENIAFVSDPAFAANREALFRSRVKSLTRPVTKSRYDALCQAHKTRMEAARLVTLLF